MKRKFSAYTIDFKKISCIDAHDPFDPSKLQLTCELTGNIEIGIEIDRWTWRGDWLLQQFFKDKASEYRITEVKNNTSWGDGTEHNRVVAIVEKRSNLCW